jgi:hypothetical protein
MFLHQPVRSAPLAHAIVNPRRCAALESVSLPCKRQKLDHISDDSGSISCLASAPQRSQLSSLQKKNSQESEGALSASKWFDNANSNIGHGLQDLSGYDSRRTH